VSDRDAALLTIVTSFTEKSRMGLNVSNTRSISHYWEVALDRWDLRRTAQGADVQFYHGKALSFAESWWRRESERRHIVGVLDASTSPPKEQYAVSKDKLIKLIQPGNVENQLTEILRNGARALLARAVAAEVADFLCKHADLKTADGYQRGTVRSAVRAETRIAPNLCSLCKTARCVPFV
jgi:hypothetical protein